MENAIILGVRRYSGILSLIERVVGVAVERLAGRDSDCIFFFLHLVISFRRRILVALSSPHLYTPHYHMSRTAPDPGSP